LTTNLISISITKLHYPIRVHALLGASWNQIMAGYLHPANSLSQFRCCSRLLCHPSTCPTAAWASPFLPWLPPWIPHDLIFGPIFNTPADNRNIVVDYRVLVVLDKYSISEFSRACITIKPHEIGPTFVEFWCHLFLAVYTSWSHIRWLSTYCNLLLRDTFQLYCVYYIDWLHCMTGLLLVNCCRSHWEYHFPGNICTCLEIFHYYICQHCLVRDKVAAILFSQYNAIW